MALITCPECKRELSDSAHVCIHCGYKFPKMQAKKEGLALKIVFLAMQALVLVMSFMPVLFTIECMRGSMPGIGYKYMGYDCWLSFGSGLFGNILDAPEVMEFSPLQIFFRTVFLLLTILLIILVACTSENNRLMAKKASWLLPTSAFTLQIIVSIITANESTFTDWNADSYEEMAIQGVLFLWIALQLAASIICIVYSAKRKKAHTC